MGRAVSRVLQVALVTVAGLLIVPFAVNLGTGGTPPSWLKPYTGWLWPAALVCVVLVIALEAVDKLGGATYRRGPDSPHNTALALAQVARYVDLRLRGSLAERVRVALALDERPAAVRQPAHLVQRVGGAEYQLSDGLHVADVFDQINESMLILGAPGSGKTTQLLDLAAALTARAQASAPGAVPAIPVVLDLVDWSRARRRLLPFGGTDRGPRDFVEWLLATLRERYRIPVAVGRAWLTDDRLTLLLDGLDEVREADRERCVQEINRLQRDLGVTRLAVCSRGTDYERLTARLDLQGAVVVRPLTEEQVVGYFTAVSPRLGGVADALRADPQLWELLTSPLMLNIMALAYGDRAADALADAGDLTQRRRHLFDAYVVEVLARRRAHEHADPERTLRALRTLATASANTDTGVRVVTLTEENAHRTVNSSIQDFTVRWVYLMWDGGCLLVALTALALSTSTAAVLAIGLLNLGPWLGPALDRRDTSIRLSGRRLLWLTGWLLAGALCTAGLILPLRSLAQVLPDVPWWAAVTATGVVAIGTGAVIAAGARGLLRLGILSASAVVGLALGGLVSLGLPAEAYAGWAVGAGSGLTMWFGFSVTVALTPKGSVPDEPVRHQQHWQPDFAAVAGLCLLGMVAVAVWLPDSGSSPFWLPAAGWLVGLVCVMFPSFYLSTAAFGLCMKLAMATAGEPVPWRRRFLRFAVDRSILTEAGGEYRFIHLLVRDHLAQSDPPTLAAQVTGRRAELHRVPQPGQIG